MDSGWFGNLENIYSKTFLNLSLCSAQKILYKSNDTAKRIALAETKNGIAWRRQSLEKNLKISRQTFATHSMKKFFSYHIAISIWYQGYARSIIIQRMPEKKHVIFYVTCFELKFFSRCRILNQQICNVSDFESTIFPKFQNLNQKIFTSSNVKFKPNPITCNFYNVFLQTDVSNFCDQVLIN